MKKYLIGISFMLIGFFFLGANLGLFDSNFMASIWQFWPLVLIILGINVLLKNTSVSYLGSLLGIGFLLIYLSIAILANLYLDSDQSWIAGPFTIRANGIETGDTTWIFSSRNNIQIEQDYELDTQTGSYEAKIAFGAGELIIGDSADKLLSVDMSVPENNKPSVNIDTDTITKVNISQSSGNKWFWMPTAGQTWDLEFAKYLPASFEIDTGASTNDLDFGNIAVSDLDFDTGASTSMVKFGLGQKKINAKFDMGAATLKILIPEGMGVYMDYDSGLSTLDLPNSIKKQSSKVYESANYDDADHQIAIYLHTGISTIEIEYYTPEENTDPTNQIEFDRIKYGSHSPYPYQQEEPHIVILNQIDSSDEPTPIIDLYESSLYDDNLVLLLLQGQRTTGGYRIKTQLIELIDDTLFTTVETLEPSRSDLVTQSITSPYDLISIAKDDLPLDSELTIILQDQKGTQLEQTSFLAE